jgi:hypothetical protein
MGLHLIGMYLMGVHLVCEVIPHANSPSSELALEFAPLIHSDETTTPLGGGTGRLAVTACSIIASPLVDLLLRQDILPLLVVG